MLGCFFTSQVGIASADTLVPNQANACVNPSSDMIDGYVNGTANNLTPFQGDLVTYTFSIGNYGPADIESAMFTDILPTSLIYVSSSVNGTPSYYDSTSGSVQNVFISCR